MVTTIGIESRLIVFYKNKLQPVLATFEWPLSIQNLSYIQQREQ